jgi:hypothetical protein
LLVVPAMMVLVRSSREKPIKISQQSWAAFSSSSLASAGQGLLLLDLELLDELIASHA